MQSLQALPANLPIPQDDGACRHLVGLNLPTVTLLNTDNKQILLSSLAGWLVIYCYPRTGQPNQALPEGWDSIPGARGCTPQSCAFRDHFQEIQHLGAQVFGLSAQSTEYQQEAVARLHLPFSLLSDSSLEFTNALKLPTFKHAGMELNKRLTIIALNGVIQHVFYPVFPPDKNADDVIEWLKDHV